MQRGAVYVVAYFSLPESSCPLGVLIGLEGIAAYPLG